MLASGPPKCVSDCWLSGARSGPLSCGRAGRGRSLGALRAVSRWGWDVGSGRQEVGRRKVSTFIRYWVRREAGRSTLDTRSTTPESCWFSLHMPFLVGPLAPATSLTPPAASMVSLLSLCPVLQPRPQPATFLQHKSGHLTSMPKTLRWLLTDLEYNQNSSLVLMVWQGNMAPAYSDPSSVTCTSTMPTFLLVSLGALYVSPSNLRHAKLLRIPPRPQGSGNHAVLPATTFPRPGCPIRMTPWSQFREGLRPQTNT